MGVMGSQQRNSLCIRNLKAKGWTQEELDMIYAPIGLDLGAQTPEEMLYLSSVSILLLCEVNKVSFYAEREL